MMCLLRTTGLILFVAIAAHAQSPFQIEVVSHGGIPLNDTLQPATLPGASSAGFVSNRTERASYLTGVSAGALIRDRLHLAFGAMYMPVSFSRTGTTCCPVSTAVTTHRRGTSWEFPLLASYRWGTRNLRPFSGGGLVLYNRTTGGENQAPAPVLSGGVELSKDSLVIRPELRYIHYPDFSSSSGLPVGRPSNQLQLLIGVGFRK